MLSRGWPLIALLAWGVLTFGAVYPWGYWPLFAAAAALGAHGYVAEKAWRDPRLKRLSIALAILVVAILTQTIALPAWLIGSLSPGVDRFFQQFRVGYHPADLQTLSLAPGATRVVLAECIAFALLLVGLTRLLRAWPLDWIVNQVMSLALAVALVGIVQEALLDDSHRLIYGFWRPRQGGSVFGPFVNRNHFAGWMVMVLPLVGAYGWSLVQRAGEGRRRGSVDWVRWMGSVDGNRLILVATCALVMAVSLVMTSSRSGMVACAVAMGVLLLFVAARTRGAARWAVTGGLLAAMAVALLWAGAGTVVARFERSSEDVRGRMAAWGDTTRIIADFPLFGTGLGGYRQAMLIYQSGGREAMYAQAHNEYLQIAAEGGVLVVLPAAAVFLVLVSGILRRLRSLDDDTVTFWIRRGAVAGLIGVAAQSVVEFSLQMPGNAAMFVAMAAVALHRSRSYLHANRV
jgi:O-antigen ligase